MQNLLVIVVGAASLLANGISVAQDGNMMNGGMWGGGWMGGYNGIWVPTLLFIIVVGVVAWFAMRKPK